MGNGLQAKEQISFIGMTILGQRVTSTRDLMPSGPLGNEQMSSNEEITFILKATSAKGRTESGRLVKEQTSSTETTTYDLRGSLARGLMQNGPPEKEPM